MADHVRRQLREAVKTRLTGLFTTGARVFETRLHPWPAADLPGITVGTPREESAYAQFDGALERNVELAIEATAKAASGIDDTLDQMAKEIEIALAADLSVAGVLITLNPEGAETTYDAETDQAVGTVRLTYRARLFTPAGAPDQLING